MQTLVKQIKKALGMVRPHERKAVLSNFASLTVLQGITYVLPVIILPYLFRVIGPEKFGLIAFAQAFVQYFMILTDYGFNVSATKEISLSRNEHHRMHTIFSDVMTAKLGLAILSLATLGLIVYFIPRFRADWMVYCLSFGAVVGNTLFPVWFFQGTEKMKHITNLNIIGGFFQALAIFLTVRGPQDYLLVPLIYSATYLFTGFAGLYVAFKRFGMTLRLKGYSQVRRQFKAGWDIFISIAAINAYTTTRVFILGLLTNNTVTGFYSIAEKIANVFQTFPLAAFTQALFPRISKIYHRNKKKAFEIMHRLQRITITISFITLPAAFIFAHWIVRVACGGDYWETVLTLRILLVAVFLIRANAFKVQFLLVCGKTDVYSRIHVVMAMIGLPLIFLLVDTFSYRGAALATVVIEAGIFTLTYFTVRKLNFSR